MRGGPQLLSPGGGGIPFPPSPGAGGGEHTWARGGKEGDIHRLTFPLVSTSLRAFSDHPIGGFEKKIILPPP